MQFYHTLPLKVKKIAKLNYIKERGAHTHTLGVLLTLECE